MAQPNKMTMELEWENGGYIEAVARINNEPKTTLVHIDASGQIEQVFDHFKAILQEHFKIIMKRIHDEMVS